MSWRDRLKRAEWRGITFLTDSHDAQEGERLVVHELPARDLPVVEDLGAAARKWRVQAYFIGANYDVARNRFLQALRTPGPGWLQHPWLGRLWVRAQSWSVSERNNEGGYATIGLSFVEGGDDVPQPTPDLMDVAVAKAQTFADAAVDWQPGTPYSMANTALEGVEGEQSFFDKLLSKVKDFRAAFSAARAKIHAGLSKVRNVLALARLPLTVMGSIQSDINNAKAVVSEALGLPGKYKQAMRSLADSLRFDLAGVSEVERLRVVQGLARTSAQTLAEVDDIGSADLRLAAAAQRQVQAQFVVSSLVLVALADYTTEAVRDAVLQTSVRALEQLLPGANDTVFEAAVAARAALQAALLAQDLAPTQTRQLVSSLPATTLAYRMGVGEMILLQRNSVRHPLFVQGVVSV